MERRKIEKRKKEKEDRGSKVKRRKSQRWKRGESVELNKGGRREGEEKEIKRELKEKKSGGRIRWWKDGYKKK